MGDAGVVRLERLQNDNVVTADESRVFRDGPFRFYFFSREEARKPVHVQCSDGEAKFWLDPNVELGQSFGLKSKQIKAALQLVMEHEDEIREAWRQHFGN